MDIIPHNNNNVGVSSFSKIITWIILIFFLILIFIISPSKKNKRKRRWNRSKNTNSNLIIEDITNHITKLLKTKSTV